MKVRVTKELEAYLSEYQIKEVVKTYLARIVPQDYFLSGENLCAWEEYRHGCSSQKIVRTATDLDEAVLAIYEYMSSTEANQNLKGTP